MRWILMLVATSAACGGSPATRAAARPEPLPPIIAREDSPDPIPTIDPVCDQDFTVADARPVSATTVGHYYIENGGLVYLVLLRGSPAWYGDLKDWQIPPVAVGQHARTVGISGFSYDVTLDIGAQSLSVRDQRVDLQKSNVVFLDRVGNDVVVRGGELLNLCWSSPPDAVGQVLSRSPAAVKFVTSGAAPGPKPKPKPARPRKR